jgi:hypothetical protein
LDFVFCNLKFNEQKRFMASFKSLSFALPPHLWQKVTEAFGGEDASTKAFAGKIAPQAGLEYTVCFKSY